MTAIETIFRNQHYTAEVLPSGSLVVTRNRKRGGVQVVGAQGKLWADYIRTADDATEAAAYCRAILNP